MTQPKRVSFDWQDPMFLEQQLSEEERVTRDLAGKCDMLIHQQETGAGQYIDMALLGVQVPK